MNDRMRNALEKAVRERHPRAGDEWIAAMVGSGMRLSSETLYRALEIATETKAVKPSHRHPHTDCRTRVTGDAQDCRCEELYSADIATEEAES